MSFVDGGHTFETARNDVLNFAKLMNKGSILVVENCNAWGMVNGFGGLNAVKGL